MLQRFSTLGRRLSAAFTEDDLIALVGNAPLIKVGNTWRVALPDNISNSAVAAAVANNGLMNIAVVTAGKLPVIALVVFGASVAGTVQAVCGAQVLATGKVPANGNMVVAFPNGFVGSVTGATIAIQNLTGGAADLAGSVVYSEYTP